MVRFSIETLTHVVPLYNLLLFCVASLIAIASLKEVVEQEASRKKKFSPKDKQHSSRQYDLFVDMIYKMLSYQPSERISPTLALKHPFITERTE